MKNNLTGEYQLINDIDCSNISNFIPIGNGSSNFGGKLFGNYFSISNVTIIGTSNDIGLFGNANGAILNDIVLINFYVNLTTVHGYVGALAGNLFIFF